MQRRATWGPKRIATRFQDLRHAALMLGAGCLVASAAVTTFTADIAAAASTPPSVSTGAVHSVEPHSVVVDGAVNPHGTATTWYFEYGPNTTFVATTPVKSAGSGSGGVSVSQTISGLAPATGYDYRIVAKNSAGTTFGSSGTFNTSSAPVVTTGAAKNISVSGATLSGAIDPEALATSWYFQYGRTTSYGAKTATGHLVASPNSANVTAPVTGLLAQTTYHFRLVATNSAGTTDGSDFSLSTGLSVTLNASTSQVVYGSAATLFGTVANGLTGTHVTIADEQFNQSAFTNVATVATGSGGAWSLSVSPTARTTYQAIVSGGSSSPIVLSVSPAVTLNRISGGRLVTQVTGAVSFARHVLQLQILSNGLWVTWKHVRLNARGKATFVTRLPAGVLTGRMAIGPATLGIDQAAPGYLAGYSRAIRVR